MNISVQSIPTLRMTLFLFRRDLIEIVLIHKINKWKIIKKLENITLPDGRNNMGFTI